MNVTPVFFSFEMIVGFDLPTEKMLRPPPPPPPPPIAPPLIPRIISTQKPMSSSVGAIFNSSPPQLVSETYVTAT